MIDHKTLTRGKVNNFLHVMYCPILAQCVFAGFSGIRLVNGFRIYLSFELYCRVVKHAI